MIRCEILEILCVCSGIEQYPCHVVAYLSVSSESRGITVYHNVSRCIRCDWALWRVVCIGVYRMSFCVRAVSRRILFVSDVGDGAQRIVCVSESIACLALTVVVVMLIRVSLCIDRDFE